MAEEKVIELVPEDDPGARVSYDGPAPLVNKFFVSIQQVYARVSFLEYSPEDQATPHFRAAVTMSINDLVALRDLLNVLLKDVQQIPMGGADAPKK